MASRMSPPNAGPGLTIAVGAAPRKGGRMDPPGGQPDTQGQGGKVSAEEAGSVMAEDHCVNCRNWHADTGECDKVEGSWDPQDACVKYFEPTDEKSEPDSDDQGPSGQSDNDADDQGSPQ